MRNAPIDFLRGIAILIMISANAYPYLYPSEYCNESLRLLFSSAAPIFTFLSGISISLAFENGKEKSALYLRAFQVLFFAVLIDVFIWSIIPFYTMDVLYLISYSSILIIFLSTYSEKILLTIVLLSMLSIGLVVKQYQFELAEIPISVGYTLNELSAAIHHIFIDGWFPLLPWVCFPALGYLAGKNRDTLNKYSHYSLMGGTGLFLGYLILYHFGLVHSNPMREGYTELFYPVSFSFILYTIGLFALITFFMQCNLKGFELIKLLGRFSLPIYFIHLFLIRFYCSIFSQNEAHFNVFILVIGLTTLYLIIFCLVFILYKTKATIKSNKFAAFILGI